MLTLNLRSTGMLSNILQEIREGRITDASWKLLQQRVLGFVDPDLPSTPASPSRPGIADVARPSLRDAHLDKEPFCQPNEVYYVFHRHALRATQGYIHALQAAAATEEPIFVCCAADTVNEADKHLWDEPLRANALHNLQARECKRSPGVLPLRRKGRYRIF